MIDLQETTFTIIGAGAVGCALAHALAGRGRAVGTVISRNLGDARRLAEEVGAEAYGDSLDLLADGRPAPQEDARSVDSLLPGETAQVIFCSVPDDEIAPLAKDLAEKSIDWDGRLIAHTSGARTSEELQPLLERGAETISFHPMQAFPSADSGNPGNGGTNAYLFKDIYIAVEGTPAGVEVGMALARDLGARPVRLATEAKVRYHLAASIASNFMVTVMDAAQEVLSSSGMEEDQAAEMLRPLINQTWRNLEEMAPTDALTGPIQRGDAGTVRRHLAALEAHHPHLLPLYRALGDATVRLARRGGLSEKRAKEVLFTLNSKEV